MEFPITNGLGLSISGGIDLPISDEDMCIYVTGIQPGGASAKDGRLRLGDRVCGFAKKYENGSCDG